MWDTLSINATRSFAEELYEFLCEIDASRWRADMISLLERRLEQLKAQLGHLTEATMTASHRELRRGFAEVERVLREHTPDPSLPARRQWKRLRLRLLPAYETIAAGLRAEAIAVPVIRPTNYSRICLHVTGMAIVLVLLALELSTPALVVSSTIGGGIFWMLELLRRYSARLNLALMRFFHRIAHPVERHRVNSATWFITSLIVLALIDAPIFSGIAVVVLGVGDPIAGLVGRRWGRVRLVHRRTLEGSLGFLFSAATMTFAYLTLAHPEIERGTAVLLAIVAALVGALSELLSNRLDDNLTIPISAAAASLAVAQVIAPTLLAGVFSPFTS